MPKESKMVTCLRCHRTVPKEDFRQHLFEHKGKKGIITETIKPVGKKSKIELPTFQEFNLTPEMKESFDVYATKKTIKSTLSEKQFLFKFKKSLKDVGVIYNTLKVKSTNEPNNIGIILDTKRNLVLTYNPLSMRALTEKAIDGLLLHEACHAFTLPDTVINVPKDDNPEMVRFYGSYISNYAEYIAHIELIKRFRNDPRFDGFQEHQICLFTNFEIIINNLRDAVRDIQASGNQINRFDVIIQLGAIVYDSLFFFVAKDVSFIEWCKKHSLDKFFTFACWIYEDFEYINSLNLQFNEKQDMVINSGYLSLSINPFALLFNKIMFADSTKKFHEELMQHGRNIDLVQLWENRRQAYQF